MDYTLNSEREALNLITYEGEDCARCREEIEWNEGVLAFGYRQPDK